MTGIAGLVDVVSDPIGTLSAIRLRIIAFLLQRRWRQRRPEDPLDRFVVLCWRRTGSNWLCGVLHGHPQVLMHNELFNESDVHTYHRKDMVNDKWTYEQRDTHPGRFLREMFHHVVDPSGTMRLVGFKSFPEHYWDRGKPNVVLTRVFGRLLKNPAIRKVILHRRNMLAVYVSMVRSKMLSAYMLHDYSDVQVRIDVRELQRFLDRYQNEYKRYRTESLRSGSLVYEIEYEDMAASPESFREETAKLFQFLGVDDNVVPQALPETILQNKRDVRLAIENYEEIEFAFRHTELGPYLGSIAAADTAQTQNETKASGSKGKIQHQDDNHDAVVIVDDGDDDDAQSAKSVTVTAADGGHRWAILLPVCSKGHEDRTDHCVEEVRGLFASIAATLDSPKQRSDIEVFFGIDEGDPVYDDASTEKQLAGMVQEQGLGGAHIMKLVNLEGKLCHIWNCLAQEAHRLGCEFFVLLGDDVRLRTDNWKTTIEDRFEDISKRRNLPFGFACVAFNDIGFPNFPTFPVVHRQHLARCQRLFPRRLQNQGGDPFLFELYKRWGASEFCFDCKLENRIGGIGEARYTKRHIRWNSEQLTTFIAKLEGTEALLNKDQVHKHLHGPPPMDDKQARIPCIDVVVPTFRLDVQALGRIVALRASIPASVTFWIVIDNPEANERKIQAVKDMEMLSNSYPVNVRCHDKNYGVSAARNTGIAYSNADFIVLLDDDVTPELTLLDAYIGAMQRHPKANVFVGLSSLSEAQTLWSRAMLACNVIGFYTIAKDQPFPPWGVTANLCVRGRTSRVRFKHKFPKTGGGEDIDYCVRSNQFRGAVVSVPGAKVTHPWWADGRFRSIRHVMGWAAGESQCIDDPDLQRFAFRTLPNSIEWALLSMVLAVFWQPVAVLGAAFGTIVFQILLRARAFHNRVPSGEYGFAYTCLVALVGAAIVSLQEAARVAAHLDRFALRNILWRFDWYCRQKMSYRAAQKTAHLVISCVYLGLVCLLIQD